MTLASRIARLRPLPLCALALVSGVAFADRPQVELADVTRGPLIQEISLNGTVTALRRSQVSVSVAGLVLERLVDTGDRVEEGAPLLRLDDELARLERDRSAAETREANSRLAEARRLLKQARSVKGGQTIAATEVSRRESEVGIAEAALARFRASEQLHNARLRRHTINAPISGVVSERAVDTGQWVEPGTAVFTLVDNDALLVDFQVPQQALARLDEQTQLLMDVPRGAERAEISSWLPVTNERSRTFLLRATPPSDSGLVPGMAVSAILRVTQQNEALSITRDAVNRYPDGRTTVWVAEPTDDDAVFKVREQRIGIAGSAGDRFYVNEGLEGSERVVSRGNESLRPDAEVILAGRE